MVCWRVWGPVQTGSMELVLLFTGLLTIPLSRQRFLDAAFFAGLQVEGMTFDFLNDVFLLDLALKPAQCIFKRLAFLNANLCQVNHTSRRPTLGMDQTTGIHAIFPVTEGVSRLFRARHVATFMASL